MHNPIIKNVYYCKSHTGCGLQLPVAYEELSHLFAFKTRKKYHPLSLVSTVEELLGRKSSDSGLENRDYCSRDPPH
jgi:hypothetical protein